MNSADGWKIVVVEDNPDTRAILVSMVQELGHAVADFEDAESALEYLAAEKIDILVADVRLPGMSGEMFAVEARVMQPTLGIVFATGVAAFASVVDDGTTTVLLCKPFGVEEFGRALASVAPTVDSVDSVDSVDPSGPTDSAG